MKKVLFLLTLLIVILLVIYMELSMKSMPAQPDPSVKAGEVSKHEMKSIFKRATSTIDSGMSAKGLWVSAQIESGGNPRSVNGKYAGLINMGEAEFKKYGAEFGDRMDPLHNLLAATYYIKDNSMVLKQLLKRNPSEAELYLSLQQGRKGAHDLLTHPHELAVKVRGHDAIIGNLPDRFKKKAEKWTCAQFTNYWVNRFNEVMNNSKEDV